MYGSVVLVWLHAIKTSSEEETLVLVLVIYITKKKELLKHLWYYLTITKWVDFGEKIFCLVVLHVASLLIDSQWPVPLKF